MLLPFPKILLILLILSKKLTFRHFCFIRSEALRMKRGRLPQTEW